MTSALGTQNIPSVIALTRGNKVVLHCIDMFQGFVYAPIFGVLANWVPAAESSLLFGLAGTGECLDT